MALNYFLAPNARWQGRTQTGQPCVNGRLYTYYAGTEDPAPTWSDPAGENENANPVELDAAGEANIYWGFDQAVPQLYFIRLVDEDGNEVFTQDNYPTVSTTNADPDTNQGLIENFVRNPQFTFWTNTTSYPGILRSVDNQDFFADEWIFVRSNTTAPVTISQQIFNLGQSVVPANPVGYVNYTCGDATGAAETYKRIGQTYASCQTMSGQTVSVAFWAKSSTSSVLSCNAYQDFGTGGTPSAIVATNLRNALLTPVWTRYTATVTLPSVAGKTLGSNGDDLLSLAFDLPLNTASTSIDICNVQFQVSNRITNFIPNSQDNQFTSLATLINSSIWKTGDIKHSFTTEDEDGWIFAGDTITVGNGASGATYTGLSMYALFVMIWTNSGTSNAAIFTSAGAPSTYGASAAADFAANKRLQVTISSNRVIANGYGSHAPGVVAGAATTTFSGTATGTTSTPVTFTHTITTAQMPPHTHTVPGTYQNNVADGGSHSACTDAGTTATSSTGNGDAFTLGPTSFAGTFTGTASGSGVSTIQPTTYYNMKIKL